MSADPVAEPEPRFRTWEEAVRWLMDQPDQQDLVRACYFDRPAGLAADRYRASGEWREVRALLPTGERSTMRALDLGAGNGIASAALASEGFAVDALEPDPSTLVGAGAVRALASERGLPIEVHEGFGEALPFPDARFDVVVARQVLHHARDLDQLCGELFRVLKPGGVLLALRDHVVTSDEQMQAFLDRHPLHHLYGGEHAFTLARYRAALEGVGFKVARCFGPLSSPINLEPMTPADVGREFGRRLPLIGGIVGTAVALPLLWPVVAPLLDELDGRPGRLTSFHCVR